MALTTEQEKQLEEMFKQKLQEQYMKGLRVGILTVSEIILNKLNDSSNPLMKRIEDVKSFCEISKKLQAPDVLDDNNNVNTSAISEGENDD